MSRLSDTRRWDSGEERRLIRKLKLLSAHNASVNSTNNEATGQFVFNAEVRFSI